METVSGKHRGRRGGNYGDYALYGAVLMLLAVGVLLIVRAVL